MEVRTSVPEQPVPAGCRRAVTGDEPPKKEGRSSIHPLPELPVEEQPAGPSPCPGCADCKRAGVLTLQEGSRIICANAKSRITQRSLP